MSKLINKSLIIFFLLCSSVEHCAAIYICTDSKGTRHYSDKKCPPKDIVKTEVVSDLGKTTIPNSILQFTQIIQIVKRALDLIKTQYPSNDLYQRAFQYTLSAEKNHSKFLSSPPTTFPAVYNPFDPVKLENIIAAISYACRTQAYMTICAVIESNYWLNGEEQIHLKKLRASNLQYKLTQADKVLYCKKADFAHKGGVVGRKVVKYFCGR